MFKIPINFSNGRPEPICPACRSENAHELMNGSFMCQCGKVFSLPTSEQIFDAVVARQIIDD